MKINFTWGRKFPLTFPREEGRQISDFPVDIFPNGQFCIETIKWVRLGLFQQLIWVKVFKNGPRKICRRQTLKNLDLTQALIKEGIYVKIEVTLKK